MRAHLSDHDDRLSKLEHTLLTMKSSVETAQAINSGIVAEQKMNGAPSTVVELISQRMDELTQEI